MPSLPRPRLGFGTRSPEPAAPASNELDGPQIETVESHGLRWVNVARPGRLELAWLREHYDFHALDFEDVASRNQRPKVDRYDDYLFVVLHFPDYDKTIGRLNAAELDVFVGPDFVITIPNRPLRTIEYLFSRVEQHEEERERHFSRGSGYLLYRIVDECVDASFPMLRKIGNKLEQLEEDIFEGRSREIVRDISNAKQEIINFRKIVRPQRTALKDLNAARRYLAEDQELYFDDINDASERIWDMLENYKEVSEALESSNESVLAHAQSHSLNVLTAISVVVLPLTLIASIWGMNVHVPGQDQVHPFFILIGVMLVLLVGMTWWFKRNDLL
ncbi:Magnesium and cobalt transport protein CorA [Patulibacter medicamentivorans]|uniref:Magnesium and cobalt transport protein CorA n=1 Tax=Patulibacter medicamentivorans TaxID=1097667 RepID=H0EA42_9ACTN|nr:magnesium transporter CorA family protein [Patulibacter medicamentivorans]EHN09480.1 Magnesium and cobalt transport protein CorA [Patulibacter medicamentivorans]